MFRFLETDLREQKKHEKRIQTSCLQLRILESLASLLHHWYNTVNDFKNHVKEKITLSVSETMLVFIKQKYILFSETYFFKIPRDLIASAFFC